MKTRAIGSTDVSVSEIGLGCWALGGPNWENGTIPSGWAPIDEPAVIEAVEFALDNGVTHFDNADVYGNGSAERLLAKALGARNPEAVISSKVGYFKGCAGHPYEPLHIRQQCEQSLQNLKRDVIDIYYFHHCNFGKSDIYLEDATELMYRLKDEGKIRAIGLSGFSNKEFKRVMPVLKPDVVQSWAHMMDYHFITKKSPLMELCEEFNTSFIAFQPLNQGILLDKYSSKEPPTFGDGDHRSKHPKFQVPYLQRAEKGLPLVKGRFGSNPEELSRAALQFVLYHKNVAGVIPGFRNREQVEQNIKLADKPLNGDDIAFIYRAFQS